jgi:hypothetical protein
MAIPSTNIELANDIYGEANGGYSSGQVSLNDISFYSYFAGPNGTNPINPNEYPYLRKITAYSQAFLQQYFQNRVGNP